MLKRTVEAGGVFLGPLGRQMSKSILVPTLGVVVSLRWCFDLKAFYEEEVG